MDFALPHSSIPLTLILVVVAGVGNHLRLCGKQTTNKTKTKLNSWQIFSKHSGSLATDHEIVYPANEMGFRVWSLILEYGGARKLFRSDSFA